MRIASLIVLLSLAGPTTSPVEPVLPRGLGFRIAGQPETPEQLADDLRFVQIAIPEAGLDASVRQKLATAVDDASEKLKPRAKSAPADEVSRKQALEIREQLDREAGPLLSAGDRKRLLERVTIVWSELFLLNNGSVPSHLDSDVEKQLTVTAEQKQAFNRGVAEMEAALEESKDAEPSARRAVLNRFRIRFRNVLSETQRKQWDQIVLDALAKAAAENKKK